MNYLGPTARPRLNEAVAVVFLFAGLFLLVSLASYNPYDPSWNTATFAANTWLNARYTARTRRPRWRRAFAIYIGGLVVTTAALTVAGSLDAGPGAELAIVGLTWTIAGLARFLLLGRTPSKGTSR